MSNICKQVIMILVIVLLYLFVLKTKQYGGKGMMTVHINTGTEVFGVDVDYDSTVRDLENLLRQTQQQNYMKPNSYLEFDGRRLEPNTTLADINLGTGSTVNIVDPYASLPPVILQSANGKNWTIKEDTAKYVLLGLDSIHLRLYIRKIGLDHNRYEINNNTVKIYITPGSYFRISFRTPHPHWSFILGIRGLLKVMNSSNRVVTAPPVWVSMINLYYSHTNQEVSYIFGRYDEEIDPSIHVD